MPQARLQRRGVARRTQKDVLVALCVDDLAESDDVVVPELLEDRNLLPEPVAKQTSNQKPESEVRLPGQDG